MRSLIFTFALIVFLGSCNEKEASVMVEKVSGMQVDYLYRPLVNHFSSTGCGPCGRFGIPVLNGVADQMGDSIVPLITHFKYNDPFITESSLAIESAILEEWYSPQIWINKTNITYDIIYDNVKSAIVKTVNLLRDELLNEAEAYVGITANFNSNNRFDIEYVIENAGNDSANFYVEVYSMEDSIIASQAGATPFVSTHYKVNRGGFYGGMGKLYQLSSNEQKSSKIEFIPCWICSAEDLYFYIIVWKEVSEGRFEYVNGKVLRP